MLSKWVYIYNQNVKRGLLVVSIQPCWAFRISPLFLPHCIFIWTHPTSTYSLYFLIPKPSGISDFLTKAIVKTGVLMETWVTASWVILAVHVGVRGTSVPHARSVLIWAVTSFPKLLPSQVTREPFWGRRDGRYSISLLHFSRAKLPSSKTSIMVSDGLYFRAGWQQEGIGFRNSHLAFATVCPLPCSASSQLSHNPSAHSSWTCPHAQSRRASSEVCRRQSASQQALLQADHKKEVGLSAETFLRAYCGLSMGNRLK